LSPISVKTPISAEATIQMLRPVPVPVRPGKWPRRAGPALGRPRGRAAARRMIPAAGCRPAGPGGIRLGESDPGAGRRSLRRVRVRVGGPGPSPWRHAGPGGRRAGGVRVTGTIAAATDSPAARSRPGGQSSCQWLGKSGRRTTAAAGVSTATRTGLPAAAGDRPPAARTVANLNLNLEACQ
jgi:hypothetical protein